MEQLSYLLQRQFMPKHHFKHVYDIETGYHGSVALFSLRNKHQLVDADSLPPTVAIKQILCKAAVESFTNEFASLIGVDHPNIVKVFGWTLSNAGYCLVMEFCELGCAQDLLLDVWPHRSRNYSDWRQLWVTVCLVGMDMYAGLDFLHTSTQLVHRDAKTSNGLIKSHVKGGSGRLHFVLCDFSFTCCLEKATDILGTGAYMAPEVLESVPSKLYTGAVDVYSLGMSLVEACIAPFREEIDFLLLVRNALTPDETAHLWPRTCPNRLRSLLLSSVSFDAKKRPSAAQMSHTFAEIRNQLMQEE